MKTNMQTIRTLLTALLLAPLASLHAADAPKPATKPNIIFILADDLGMDGVGCYGAETRKTPQIDKLAATGMRFQTCYAMPMCAPSRTTLISGRYPFRTGGLQQVGIEQPIAKLLKQAGYVTGQAGKWRQTGGMPDDWGFDEYCSDNTAGGWYWQDTYIKNGQTINAGKDAYNPDIIQAFTIDFIKRHKDQPFFFYYAMHLVHTPIMNTPDSPKGAKDGADRYEDNIEYMDKQVGALVAELEKLGLREKTLIVFSGDNGSGKIGASPIGGRIVNGCKLSMLEGGSRVPFIASWPGTTPAGKVSPDIVSFADPHATFLELAGVTPPTGIKFDGISLAPQLRGEKGTPREWAFVQFGPNWFVREQGWKMNESGELFDMGDAPFVEKLVAVENDTAESKSARQRLTKVLAELNPAAGNTSGGEEEQLRRQSTRKDQPGKKEAIGK